MTLWFILLMLGGFWIILSIIEFLAGVEDLILNPTDGNVLFGIFIFFVAKSATETLESVLRDKSQKHLFSAPVRSDSIFYSKFMKVWTYNLILFGMAMVVVSSVVSIWNIELPIDRYFVILLYLLIILAPLVGFNTSIMIHIDHKRLKIANAAASGTMISFAGLMLHSNTNTLTMIYYTIFMIAGVFLISILSSKAMYRDSWTRSTQNSESSVSRSRTLSLPSLFSKTTKIISEIELTRRCRRRQIPSSLVVVLLLGGGVGFFYWTLGPTPDIGLGLDEYFYPALISMTAFIASIIHVLIPSLDLFSRDGKRLWCLRSIPKDLESVIAGKVLAILIPSPMITAVIALPLPLVLGYPLSYVFLSGMGSFTIIFLMSGIGIWAAVKFPNFNESTNGAPDIITMYSTVMLGLLLSVIFLSVPITLVEIDILLAVLTIILATDLALLFMILMIKRSAQILKRMEFNF